MRDAAARAAVERFMRNVRSVDPAFHRLLLDELHAVRENMTTLGALGELGQWEAIVGTVISAASSIASGVANWRAASAQRHLVEEQIRQLRAANAANVYANNYQQTYGPPAAPPATNNPPPATVGTAVVPPLVSALSDPKVFIPIGLVLLGLVLRR